MRISIPVAIAITTLQFAKELVLKIVTKYIDKNVPHHKTLINSKIKVTQFLLILERTNK